MAPQANSAVLNYVIRMVVPMRREFGRSLDVQLFMRDSDYAQSVLDEALGSGDQRLRDYAIYVKQHLGGARDAAPPRQATGASAKTDSALAESALRVPAAVDSKPPAVSAAATDDAEAELRERMLRKYTGGLR